MIPVIKINCGGETIGEYLADTPYAQGGQSYIAAGAPSDEPQWGTVRYGQTFGYVIPVPPGNYHVVIECPEVFYEESGKRVFNITCNGFAVSGQLFGPATVSFDVSGDNGEIWITFMASVDNAAVAAIQIFSADEPVVEMVEVPKTAIEKVIAEMSRWLQ